MHPHSLWQSFGIDPANTMVPDWISIIPGEKPDVQLDRVPRVPGPGSNKSAQVAVTLAGFVARRALHRALIYDWNTNYYSSKNTRVPVGPNWWQ